MPRSYRFEHFKVPKKETDVLPRLEKQRWVTSQLGPMFSGLHYGKKFARTEELAHEHQRSPRKPSDNAFGRGDQVVDQMTRGAPLGGVSNAQEVSRPDDLVELLSDGSRYLRLGQQAS